MTHKWRPKHYPGGTNELVNKECENCLICKNSMFYSNLPGFPDSQIFSTERNPEPVCELMVIKRVMAS